MCSTKKNEFYFFGPRCPDLNILVRLHADRSPEAADFGLLRPVQRNGASGGRQLQILASVRTDVLGNQTSICRHH